MKKKSKKTVKKKIRSPADDLLKTLSKLFGDEVVWTTAKKEEPIDVIPCRTQSVNWVLGRGGLPRGRLIEFFGQESSGKTTACYHFVKTVQEQGGLAVYIDVENAIDIRYMEQAGVDRNKLIIVQPDYAEQALGIVEKVIENGKADLIVLDSVADLVPKAELEGDMTDQQIGLQARVVAKNIRRITPMMRGSKTALLVCNQLRDKIGGSSFGFGPQTSTPGGRALKHAATIRAEFKRTTTILSGAKQAGFFCRIRVVKNKVGIPFRQVSVPIIYGYGIDDRLDWLELALKSHALKKKGGLYYLKQRVIANSALGTYDKLQAKVKLLDFVQGRIDSLLEKWSDGGVKQDSAED